MAMSKMYVKRSRYQTHRKKPANKKLATVGTVKRLINHNVDQVYSTAQAIAAVNMTSTATITQLGNNVNVDIVNKFLKIRAYITNPTLNVNCRMIFFQWKDTTVPVVADVLRYTTDVNSTLGAGNDGEACGGKMHLLRDYHFVLDPVWQTNKALDVTFYEKKILDYKSDGTETKNYFYILFISNTAATPPVLSLDTLHKYHSN